MSFLTDPNRYTDRPLLRLLECYVLEAMGELGESQRRALEEITPRLREIHQAKGTWTQIVEQIKHLPSDTPARIRALWEKNLAATPPQPRLKAQPFAERFVDLTLGQRSSSA